MHHSRILKRAFSVAHHRAAAERKECRSSLAELTGLLRRQLGGSVANDAHRRVGHEKAWCGLTPCGVDLPTIYDPKGRNRFCAHALHFDTLRDKRTGDENRLLSHFFFSLLAPLD